MAATATLPGVTGGTPGTGERLRRALVIAAVAAVVYVPGLVTLWMLLAGRA